ncbi:hypothetical protein LCGC14_1738650 [marine sediment metagenome]|uniref:Uncharacterized protein n=1 Tax=marine sediment metagenome TaxID=412755 RepID=A0A0F9JMM9_9ZZZZ
MTERIFRNIKEIVESEESKEYIDELKFPISELSIYRRETQKYYSIGELPSAIEVSSDGEKNPITLYNVFLDTGNTTSYCLIAEEFKTIIDKEIFDSTLRLRDGLISSISDKGSTIKISENLFKFKLFDTTFGSQIAFLKYHPKSGAMKTQINIGLRSLRQFLNLLFYNGSKTYYLCSNIPIESNP